MFGHDEVEGILDDPMQAETDGFLSTLAEAFPSGFARDAPTEEARTEEAAADPAAGSTAEAPARPDLMGFFRSLLTSGVRAAASEIRLLPTTQGHTRIRFVTENGPRDAEERRFQIGTAPAEEGAAGRRAVVITTLG